MIANLLRRIADWIDPPEVEYAPSHATITVELTEPVVPWVTSRHEKPDAGDATQRPDEDHHWEQGLRKLLEAKDCFVRASLGEGAPATKPTPP